MCTFEFIHFGPYYLSYSIMLENCLSNATTDPNSLANVTISTWYNLWGEKKFYPKIFVNGKGK